MGFPLLLETLHPENGEGLGHEEEYEPTLGLFSSFFCNIHLAKDPKNKIK